MLQKRLEDLLKQSLTLRVEGIGVVNHAITASALSKILTNFQESFNGYVEAGFFHDEELSAAYKHHPAILEALKQQLELYVIQVQPGSVGMSLAPNIQPPQAHLFAPKALNWQENIFKEYKQDVIMPEYSAYDAQRLANKFTAPERKRIYAPFFAAIGISEEKRSYKINLWDMHSKRDVRELCVPERKVRSLLVPRIGPERMSQEMDGIILGHVTHGKGNPKVKIYEVITDPLVSIPVALSDLVYDGFHYSFNSALKRVLRKEDDVWFMSCPELNIEVWDSDINGAKDAFAYAFHSLYRNYVLEDVAKLSPDAVALREKIKALIKSVTRP